MKICPYFSRIASYNFLSLGWFMRSEISDRTVAFFSGGFFLAIIKTSCCIFVQFPFWFIAMNLIRIQVVQLYCTTDRVTIGRKSILFCHRDQIFLWSIAVNDFCYGSLTSLSVDEIFLLKYLNFSTNWRGFPLIYLIYIYIFVFF